MVYVCIAECLKWQIFLIFNKVKFNLKLINESSCSPNHKLPLLQIPNKYNNKLVLLKSDEIFGYVESLNGIDNDDGNGNDSNNDSDNDNLIHLIETNLRISFVSLIHYCI